MEDERIELVKCLDCSKEVELYRTMDYGDSGERLEQLRCPCCDKVQQEWEESDYDHQEDHDY